jgi:uncharacterized protein
VNISRGEQRTLHALAQGGCIEYERNANGKINRITCHSREGWVLADCTLRIFKKLRKRRLIASRDGKPYRITRTGLVAVRPQLDNR